MVVQLHWNKKWIFATAGAIVSAWVLLFAFTSSAKTTSQKVKDAKEEVKESKENLEESKKSITEMEAAKAKLEGKLAELNKELAQVSQQLEDAENQLVQKQAQIEEIKAQLAEAEANETEQFESMKKRIKYMYENGNEDMLQMILEGGSFSEMLNKTEFFSKMMEYDRKMLNEYSATKDTIATAKAQLELEEQDLQSVVAQVEARKKEVNHLVSKTTEEIAKQESDLEEAEKKALAYEQELKAQRNTLEALQAQEAEEQRILAEAKRQREAGGGNSTAVNRDSSGNVVGSGSGGNISTGSSGYSEAASASDLKLLATIIYCEAGNQPYEGMIAVGSVVMNRINSPLFPGTMLGVLYQKSQFTPVMSGRFAIALAKNSATSTCYSAAQEVLNGRNNVPNCLFFRTVIPGKEGTIIGAHVFY